MQSSDLILPVTSFVLGFYLRRQLRLRRLSLVEWVGTPGKCAGPTVVGEVLATHTCFCVARPLGHFVCEFGHVYFI